MKGEKNFSHHRNEENKYEKEDVSLDLNDFENPKAFPNKEKISKDLRQEKVDLCNSEKNVCDKVGEVSIG